MFEKQQEEKKQGLTRVQYHHCPLLECEVVYNWTVERVNEIITEATKTPRESRQMSIVTRAQNNKIIITRRTRKSVGESFASLFLVVAGCCIVTFYLFLKMYVSFLLLLLLFYHVGNRRNNKK